MHVLDIHPYLHKFFDPILSDSIFSLPWTIIHGRKGKFSQILNRNISEIGEAPPTKIGTHVLDINPYLHKVFDPILSDSIFFTTMDYSPWSERENWSNFKIEISPKSEKPHPQKLVLMYYTSTPTCIYFLSQFKLIQFFHYHGI